ncbi:hypothetical protein GMRT_11568 [Giardia muris]|uniref:Uncharacterized protein n=1 Tax=Giardia muris TaxID=5742 RepID=A0A4Z1SXB8_GIAMU|nr:hypothetical protein GMRT_11568 [Giardia muris]|eukprot:TNJ30346.1 hypothetical protein GMRT_11568 [Giardia muris]
MPLVRPSAAMSSVPTCSCDGAFVLAAITAAQQLVRIDREYALSLRIRCSGCSPTTLLLRCDTSPIARVLVLARDRRLRAVKTQYDSWLNCTIKDDKGNIPSRPDVMFLTPEKLKTAKNLHVKRLDTENRPLCIIADKHSAKVASELIPHLISRPIISLDLGDDEFIVRVILGVLNHPHWLYPYREECMTREQIDNLSSVQRMDWLQRRQFLRDYAVLRRNILAIDTAGIGYQREDVDQERRTGTLLVQLTTTGIQDVYIGNVSDDVKTIRSRIVAVFQLMATLGYTVTLDTTSIGGINAIHVPLTQSGVDRLVSKPMTLPPFRGATHKSQRAVKH